MYSQTIEKEAYAGKAGEAVRPTPPVQAQMHSIGVHLNSLGILLESLDQKLQPLKATAMPVGDDREKTDGPPPNRCEMESELWEIGQRIGNMSSHLRMLLDQLRV